MTIIAVAPHKYYAGVGNLKNKPVLSIYEHIEVEEALNRAWKTDAHLVCYLVEGCDRMQPRLNKIAVSRGTNTAQMTTFMVDVDNPGHAPWTPEWREAAIEFDREHVVTEGLYHTTNGRRLVQPLAQPVSIAVAERYFHRWLAQLEARGFAVDWDCKDWTRHFRLPHVWRDRKPFRTPLLDLSRMKPIVLEPIPDPEIPPVSEPRRRKPRRAGGGDAVDFSTNVPEGWRGRIEPIARAIRETVTDHWHAMHLALGGALLRHRLAPEQLPTVIFAVATAAGSYDPANDQRGAQDTARRWLDGLPVTGMGELARRWPGVANAVERVMLASTYEVTETVPPAEPKPLEETIAALEEVIRNAPDGLTIVNAECGIGKTRTAQSVAVDRARRRHLHVVDSNRAPVQSKTSISVDKNELAIQITNYLRKENVAVRRIYGPLSVMHRQDDGTLVPECIYHDSAEPLVAGAQSLKLEFCEGRGVKPCERYDECTARAGVDGPDAARITVGTHPLVGELAGAAGKTGLLVIDEPPPTLEIVHLSREDIALTREMLHAFEPRFVTAMLPALDAAETWNDTEQAWCDITDTIDVSGAFDDDDKRRVPPLRGPEVFAARRAPKYAQKLGTASTVLLTLYRALTESASVRLEDDTITVVLPNTRLAKAIAREGATIIMDANADIHLGAYKRIVGYDPFFHRFAAKDGAPIERSLLRTTSATRKGWFSHGRLVLNTGVLHAIREVLAWAGTSELAIITYRAVEIVLRAAIDPTDPAPAQEWKALKQRSSVLQSARKELVELRGRRIALAHYGATRGLDDMMYVDALATLGDPWPNLGDVRHIAEFSKEDPDALAMAMARAELEQAHGRLRTVHRTRPARALHVGTVVPGGSGWSNGQVIIRQMNGGRPKGVPHMSADELRTIVDKIGGLRSAATVLKCSKSALHRYLSGERAISAAVATDIRETIATRDGFEPVMIGSDQPSNDTKSDVA